LPRDNNIVLRINAMNLKHVLGNIQTNRGNLHVGGPLLM
jgi:hypothetical protein